MSNPNTNDGWFEHDIKQILMLNSQDSGYCRIDTALAIVYAYFAQVHKADIDSSVRDGFKSVHKKIQNAIIKDAPSDNGFTTLCEYAYSKIISKMKLDKKIQLFNSLGLTFIHFIETNGTISFNCEIKVPKSIKGKPADAFLWDKNLFESDKQAIDGNDVCDEVQETNENQDGCIIAKNNERKMKATPNNDNKIREATAKFINLYNELGEQKKNNNIYFCEWEGNDITHPRYTWQWNFTVEEYDRIKSLMKANADILKSIAENKIACKLIQLYVSEWYKRDYNGNSNSNEDDNEGTNGNALTVLGTRLTQQEICECLGIGSDEVYRINRRRWLDTIYVDGGLPLNYLLTKEHDLKETIRKIIENEDVNEDLEFLCGNKVIKQSYEDGAKGDNEASIYHFIQDVIIEKKIVIDGFANFIEQLTRTSVNTNNLPFSNNWLISINDVCNQIKVSFQIDIPFNIKDCSEFLEEHSIKDGNFTIVVSINDDEQSYKYYRYTNNKCGFNFGKIKINCKFGDQITIGLLKPDLAEEKILATRSFDISDPKLLFPIDSNNTFTLCGVKRLEQAEKCRIVATPDWSCKEENVRYVEYRDADGNAVKVFLLCQESNELHLNSETNGSKSFSYNQPLIWTELNEGQRLIFDIPIKEKIYNAFERLSVKACHDDVEENTIRDFAKNVLYARQNSRTWEEKCYLGRVRAKACVSKNESVDPVRFINTGNLSIAKIESSRDVCKIKIVWEYGGITSNDADFENDIWTIERNRLNDRGYVKFTFTPKYNLGDEFELNIAPVFEDFIIYDENNKPITYNAVLSVDKIASYRYYLCTQGRWRMTQTIIVKDRMLREKRRIDRGYYYIYQNIEKGVQISETFDNNKIGEPTIISNSGYLDNFFMNNADIRYLIDLAPCKSIDAEVLLEFKRETGDLFRVRFKVFTAGIQRKEDENAIATVMFEDILSNTTFSLFAIPFDNPSESPVCLEGIGNNYFSLESILARRDYRSWLIYNSGYGKIKPLAIDFDCNRFVRREFRIALLNQYNNAPLNSDIWNKAVKWFDLVVNKVVNNGYDILELEVLASTNKLLYRFAYLLYNCEQYDHDVLKFHLLFFQQQMNFIWAWVKIDDGLTVTDDFVNWFQSLKSDSIPDKKLTNPDLNHNVYLIPERSRVFFGESDKYPTNDEWIETRRMWSKRLSMIDWDMKTDIQNPKDCGLLTQEIRNSIINGLKFKKSDEV